MIVDRQRHESRLQRWILACRIVGRCPTLTLRPRLWRFVPILCVPGVLGGRYELRVERSWLRGSDMTSYHAWTDRRSDPLIEAV